MTVHRLKTLAPYFGEVTSGAKPFEVRRDDRGFQLGDILHLVEISDAPGLVPTGREAEFEVTYVLPGGEFGIQAGFVVLGLASVSSSPFYPDCSTCGHNASAVVAGRCTAFVSYPDGDPRGIAGYCPCPCIEDSAIRRWMGPQTQVIYPGTAGITRRLPP